MMIKKLLRLTFIAATITFIYSNTSYAGPVTNCKGWRPNWEVCKVDADCTVIPNSCGWPTSAANKLFSEAASQCNRIEGAALSCASWDEMDNGKRISKCDAGKCINQKK